MSATNHTTNYELPIFVGSDKPAWLVDWNGAMTAIDTAIHTAEGKADQAGTDIGGIESSISTINSTLTSINNAVSQLRIDTNANTGSINTITSLIGNGTPTTTDKTIIGAINEINSHAIQRSLPVRGSFTVTASSANIDVYSSDARTSVKFANSADGTYGKIYGGMPIAITALTSGAWTDVCTLASSDFNAVRPSSEYYIEVGCIDVYAYPNYTGRATISVRFAFTTAGTVKIQFYAGANITTNMYGSLSLPDGFYIFDDFGD